MLLGADVLLAPEGDIQAPTYKLTTFSVSIVAFVICAFLNQRGAQPQGQYQRVHIYILEDRPPTIVVLGNFSKDDPFELQASCASFRIIIIVDIQMNLCRWMGHPVRLCSF